MKLDPAKRTNVTYDDYVDALKSAGYKCIGSGSFASVYAKHGSKTVIKVGLLDLYDTWKDDGYVSFLKIIDPKNPMFPKIVRVERYIFRHNPSLPYAIDNTGRYYVVEMERLADHRAVSWKTRREVLNRIGLTSIYDFGRIKHRKLKSVWAIRANAILERLWRYRIKDMHDGNVMFRKKKDGKVQMVITDPAT